VKLGTKLQVAYFDQLRDQLDLERNVIDNVAGGRDSVTINGRDRHIYSYLSDFLFSPERSRTPVKALSGGERNRLLLAKLFSLPANLLVLDEPTNDLDMETLELLEQLLTEFDGTILVVSHDRRFIDNIVTSTFVFAGNGIIKEYVGGFEDWLRQGGKISLLSSTLDSQRDSKTSSANTPAAEDSVANAVLASEADISFTKSEPAKTKKLSFKLQRELDALPGQIDALEKEIESIKSTMANVDFYSRDRQLVADTIAQLEANETVLENYYARWAELDS
jgi:ATP-binding cassette subfamily F protein uup